MRKMWAAGAAVGVVLVIVGLPTVGQSPGPSGATASDVGSLLVRAAVACSSTPPIGRSEGVSEIYVEHFTCTYDATDSRLDGRVEGDVTATFEPAAATAARWEGTFTITNEGGSWRGQEQGALVIWPGSSRPYNYGQGTYTGLGAYEGLTYHYLIAGGNEGLVASGWIESQE